TCPYNRGASNGQRLRVRRQIRNPARITLGKEQVHESLALRALAALIERITLELIGRVLGPRASGFNTIDDLPRSQLTAGLALQLLPEEREHRRIYARDLVGQITGQA